MASQITLIWAAATGAAALVGAAAAAVYWEHPAFLWPVPASAVSAQAPIASSSAIPVVPSAAGPPPAAAAAPSPAGPPPLASAIAPPTPEEPTFDVVSIEPTGETVVAGRAAPNARVELRDAGKTLAEATANREGQFVIIPPVLPPGEHRLALSAGAGDSTQTSNAIDVTVSAPAPKATVEASVPASSSPPAATPLTAPAPAVGGPAVKVAVQSIEASAGGRLVAKGAAAPNAMVRLYLSGAFVGDVKTSGDGRWSLTIEHGMTPGPYEMRADEINPADAKVEARAETPFNYPASAAAPAPAPAAPAGAMTPPSIAVATGTANPPSPSPPANIVVDAVKTHHVEPGHTLWGISQKFYGDGSRYQAIFAANSGQIRDPHWIYPGQVFVVPKEPRKP